jgi:hypothetical protein
MMLQDSQMAFTNTKNLTCEIFDPQPSPNRGAALPLELFRSTQ